MESPLLYLLQHFGLWVTGIAVLGYVLYKLGNIYLENKGRVDEIKAKGKADVDRLQKEYDLKVAEEERIGLNNGRQKLNSLVEKYHECLDELIDFESRFWQMHDRKTDMKYWYQNFNIKFRDVISLTRMNTNVIGLEAAGHIEGELAKLGRILNVSWKEVGRDANGSPLVEPSVPFAENDRIVSYQLLMDLMEYTNGLNQEVGVVATGSPRL